MQDPVKMDTVQIEQTTVDLDRTDRLADGQKAIIYGFIGYFGSFALIQLLDVLGFLMFFFSVLILFHGVSKVGHALGLHAVLRWGLIVLMFVPTINLLTLLVLFVRVNRILRQHGYKVGLMGAELGGSRTPSV